MPDSSWYTNRRLGALWSDALLRGANTLAPVRMEIQGPDRPLTVIRPTGRPSTISPTCGPIGS